MDMNFVTYKNLVNNIQIGKHLPDAVYLHQSALHLIPPALLEFFNHTITLLELNHFNYTVVKFLTRDFKFSLLDYPDFFKHPYPALHTSCTINLTLGKYRISSYTTSNNPPILHRKETFLPPNHPAIPSFCTITIEAEQAGLFQNVRRIGFKQNWEILIKQQGYQIQNGHLVPLE